MGYYLKVYDNFNYMEEDEVYYVRSILRGGSLEKSEGDG
jgi:hypothetical protein